MFDFAYVLAFALMTAPGDSPETALAAALLTTPADTPETVPLPVMTAPLRSAILRLAIQWEIMDPREARYTLRRPEEFSSDLAQLRQRYHELANAPLVHDSLRFPDRSYIGELLAFNQAYRKHLQVRRSAELAHTWELQAALRETDQLYEIWDAVYDARCEDYYVAYRRQALKKLRHLLGEDAYYRGQLPPHVPVWRFQEIN